ncbi:MAG: hypothetical protein H6621_05120 [Halobacteriovoraceae bacterium]|nr:hypothetical protein [Halobacteriovoraceae bacterium]
MKKTFARLTIISSILSIISCSSTNSKKDELVIESEEKLAVPYSVDKEVIFTDKGSFHKETLDGLEPGNADESNDNIVKITQGCRKSNFEETLEYASSLYGAYKKWPTYWNAIGICYYLSKNDYKARLYFNRALEENSKYSPAYNNHALILIRNNQWNDALVALKKAYQFNSQSQVVNYNLGRLYLAFGHGEKAILHFSKIFDSDFFKKHVIKFMAMSYALNENYSEAVRTFDRYYEDREISESERLLFAYSLAKIGKIEQAKNIWSALDIGPKSNLYPLFVEAKGMIR